jgi:broad specificity phosphatase PhoE
MPNRENEGKYNYTGLHIEPSALGPGEAGAGGTLWMARHADVHNPSQILYGRMPRYRLSKTGQEQAAQLAEFLASQPLAALYSSPLLRTRQTAAAIAARHPGLKVQTNRLLLEVRTGYEGVPLSQVGDFNFYEPLADPSDETLEAVNERLLKFVKRVVNRHKGKSIAVVSHGDPVVILHAYFTGLPLRLASLRNPNFYPERASVTRYDFPPEGFTTDINRVRVSYFQPPFD